MSKLYNEYIRKKKEDNNKYYLFKSGMFYIFIDDEIKISKITLLRLTNLNNDIVKCCFPDNSLDKYMDVFNNLGLDVEIV